MDTFFHVLGYGATVVSIIAPAALMILWIVAKCIRAYIHKISDGRYDFDTLTAVEKKVMSMERGYRTEPTGFAISLVLIAIIELLITMIMGVIFLIEAPAITFGAYLVDIIHDIATFVAPVAGGLASLFAIFFIFHLLATAVVSHKMKQEDLAKKVAEMEASSKSE